jgi:3-hydroxybutyrate dehydrogenase
MKVEIALTYAREGANVAIADLNLDAANGAAAQIRDAGGKAFGVAMDVTNEDQVNAGVAAVVSKWGGVDILVKALTGQSLVVSHGWFMQ